MYAANIGQNIRLTDREFSLFHIPSFENLNFFFRVLSLSLRFSQYHPFKREALIALFKDPVRTAQ